jgi:hypothetical protein
MIYSPFTLEIKNLAENLQSKLILFDNSISWGRGWHYYIKEKEEQEMLLIEEKVKDWIIAFLNQSREEWKFLLTKETIEDRNWRLLKEIENLFVKK